MSVTKITLGDILNAAKETDLDEACRMLQEIAGISDGGVAGIVFSGENYGRPGSLWSKFSEKVRFNELVLYLMIELSYEADKKPDEVQDYIERNSDAFDPV